MIELERHAEGTVLPVRAQAGARRNVLRGEHAGQLQVSVTQSPDKGKANKAIVEVLSEALSLGRSQFELMSGATSPQKRFLVRGVSVDALAKRVAQALAGCK